jgi:FkbM family methyltransferase
MPLANAFTMQRCGIIICILHAFLPTVISEVEVKACDVQDAAVASALLQVKGERGSQTLDGKNAKLLDTMEDMYDAEADMFMVKKREAERKNSMAVETEHKNSMAIYKNELEADAEVEEDWAKDWATPTLLDELQEKEKRLQQEAEAPTIQGDFAFVTESNNGAVYTGVGGTAAFDDQGFFNVAKTCCPLEMLVFARRTISSMGYEVCAEAALAALIPQFTCDTATTSPSNKSFAILKDTLYRSAPPGKCAAVAPVGACFSSGARLPTEPGHESMLAECQALGKYDVNGMHYAKHCRDTKGNKPPSIAKETLPHELYLLGLETFGGDGPLNEIMLQAHHLKANYAGQHLDLRIRQGDNALLRYGVTGEDGRDYGLPIEGAEKVSLLQAGDGIMSIVDLGGNYGVVSIALYKALEGRLRSVSVEAMPSTYFFFRWNMHLNGVPLLDTSKVGKSRSRGIAAINAGVTSKEQVNISMCSTPENSMNSRENSGACRPEDTVTVPGVSVDEIFGLFEKKQIALVKLDCEGCEEQAAPDLAKYKSQVKRMVGELHVPSEKVIDSVCLFNAEKYFTKICKVSQGAAIAWQAIGLACNVPARAACNW